MKTDVSIAKNYLTQTEIKDLNQFVTIIEKSFAESEFEKYRIIQDKLYQSDFDKLLLGVGEGEKENSKTT